MEFNKVLISEKKELKRYKKDIFKLFEHSFSKELSESIWEWAYLNNPNGNPIVSLYFDGNILVGHYAIIPIKLNLNKALSESILAGLSMTTMVDVKYRKYGVFIQQAKEVFFEAKKQGYSLVYGFPNKNSAPGFIKRLGWVVDKTFIIKTFDSNNIPSDLKDGSQENMIEFDVLDDEQLKWRLKKPHATYIESGGSIIKKYQGSFDIVYYDGEPLCFSEQVVYSVLVSSHNGNDNSQPYFFGYKLFDNKLQGIEFKVDLIMSDVF